MKILRSHVCSPLGTIALESDGEALTGLSFAPVEFFEDDAATVFALAQTWLSIYFSGATPDFTPPLKLHGTPFQRLVWDMLLAIPYGETRTYGQLAAAIAKERGIPKMSAQAVGQAVGRNPIAILVPCHRVIGADGSLVGYAGGIERKARLLELEAAVQGTTRFCS